MAFKGIIWNSLFQDEFCHSLAEKEAVVLVVSARFDGCSGDIFPSGSHNHFLERIMITAISALVWRPHIIMCGSLYGNKRRTVNRLPSMRVRDNLAKKVLSMVWKPSSRDWVFVWLYQANIKLEMTSLWTLFLLQSAKAQVLLNNGVVKFKAFSNNYLTW